MIYKYHSHTFSQPFAITRPDQPLVCPESGVHGIPMFACSAFGVVQFKRPLSHYLFENFC